MKKKIMYVDDIKYSLMTVKSRLNEYYDIYPAHSAEMLFKILEKNEPDLILLDINMPDVNGYEILKMLRDNRYDVPVIFLTGKNDKKSMVKAMELGATDYVTKPFTEPGLIECIENQINPKKKAALKPVILAVDDSISVLQSINLALSSTYKVRTLPIPEVLTTLLVKVSPDLFLLDCKMPVLSGFDLVPIIRGFPGHEDTPIIFLTAAGTIDNLNVAVNLGACDFIVKPFDADVLREKIKVHTSNYIMRRRIRSISAKK